MKYTVNKILGEYPAQYGQVRVSFKVNEDPDHIISGFFAVAPKEGEAIEGDITTKQGVNKAGENVTWYNFVAPKKAKDGGVSGEQLELIKREVAAINANVLRNFNLLIGLVRDLTLDGVIHERLSDGSLAPDFSKAPSVQPEIK